MTIHVVQTDERDSRRECARPRFRVYLHGSGPDTTRGWTGTYDVTGADILQVIDWAQRQAGDRLTYAIALVQEGDDRDPAGPEPALIWLVGMDGNDHAGDRAELAIQQRMLARRDDPVGVPHLDRMPDGVPNPCSGNRTEDDRPTPW